jgi:hypothetical protein
MTSMVITNSRLSITIVFAACLLGLLLTVPAHSLGLSRHLNHKIKPLFDDRRPSVLNCTQHYFNQTLDHFTFQQGVGKWPQKYYLYDGYRKSYVKSINQKSAPVFFYGERECFLLTGMSD